MDVTAASPVANSRRAHPLGAGFAPVFFSIRMWVSVCLALFVAFSLNLENPYWAGASAAIVCQPQLGASLRKGWFRMIGTVVGATMIVVLTAWFPQDRIAYLALLALWCGVCAFVATALRNFASYGAALAGYTAAIIAADTLGATGGPTSGVFLIAVWRASEICIGIVCAGVVLAGTDRGSAQRRLASTLGDLTAEIADRFTRMLAPTATGTAETQNERREFVRRAIELDPLIDQGLGESSHIRHYASTLQAAVYGLFRVLDGWRGVATHLSQLPPDEERQAAQTILQSVPVALRSASGQRSAASWIADPMPLRVACAAAARTLVASPAETPSLRLLTDETAKVLEGVSYALDGLAVLVEAPDRPLWRPRGFKLAIADWLPPLINAARAFVVICAVESFWVATAWPNGSSPIVFAAALLLLLGPRGDLAFGGAIAVGLGVIGAVVCAAIIKFALLPAAETFPTFCLVMGLFFVPVGFVLGQPQPPVVMAIFTGMGLNFMPLLAPTNQMTYDTGQFYNSALAVVVGCATAPLAFALLPPLSPALRMRRLLALARRDLRRLASASRLPRLEDWESRAYGRLAGAPDQAEPLQRAQLLAALSVGRELIQLRHMALRLGVVAGLDAALAAFAQGRSATAIARLRQLDLRLADVVDRPADIGVALRARSRILVISEALSQHASYFDAGKTA
jgi:uncharacterized membrane protein YccC